MFGNNTLNFQEFTAILNASTKKKISGNLLNALHISFYEGELIIIRFLSISNISVPRMIIVY